MSRISERIGGWIGVAVLAGMVLFCVIVITRMILFDRECESRGGTALRTGGGGLVCVKIERIEP